MFRITWYRSDVTKNLICGEEVGCEIEFWRKDSELGELVAPRANQAAPSIPLRGDSVHVPAESFTQLAATNRVVLPPIRTRAELAVSPLDDIHFPIDLVYTWVDGSDPEWQERRSRVGGNAYHPEAASPARFLNRDELLFSLRSVHTFAPWVRNIYVVTADQTPSWLDGAHPGIELVSHSDIFSDPRALPTFSSRAIESQLHHIDGLSEQFIYMNDDMFFAGAVTPSVFFEGNGLSKFFLSAKRVPLGDPSAKVTPVQAGAMNNRRLVERKFGRSLTRTTLHAPYALRRSVLAEIEKEFPDEINATMMSQLRDVHTITVTSSLHHYYAYYSGRAVPGAIRYGYVRLDAPNLQRRLQRVLQRRDLDALCLNDAYSTAMDIEMQNAALQPFLESYFPVPSPYEQSG